MAVYELVRRHVTVGMTVANLAGLLAGGRCLDDAIVERVDLITGEVPVTTPAEGAACVIRLPGGSPNDAAAVVVYLALDRIVDPARLRDCLTASDCDPTVAEARVTGRALHPERLSTVLPRQAVAGRARARPPRATRYRRGVAPARASRPGGHR